MGRRRDLVRLSNLYSRIDNLDDTTCFYCGCSADCTDHVPPLTVADSLGQGLLYKFKYLLVPSCRECNSILSNMMLPTIELRCLVLAGEYAKSYSSYLIIDTDDDDISLDSELCRRRRVTSLNREELKCRIDHLTAIDSRMGSVNSVPSPEPEESWYRKERYQRQGYTYPVSPKERIYSKIVADREAANDKGNSPELQAEIDKYFRKVASDGDT